MLVEANGCLEAATKAEQEGFKNVEVDLDPIGNYRVSGYKEGVWVEIWHPLKSTVNQQQTHHL